MHSSTTAMHSAFQRNATHVFIL